MKKINKRYFSVFAGENTWKEFFLVIRYLVFGWNIEYFSNRSKINIFEKRFKKFVHRNYASSFGSGRMALFSILRSLKIEPNDEVILQGFTCNVVPRAIKSIGAKPIYVDIEPNTFNMDIDLLLNAITDNTKAIIIQHTFGIPMSLSKIENIIGGRDIAIIEDCAHSFHPVLNGNEKNFLSFSFFSTDHSKPLNTHIGGVVCTNSIEHGELIAKIASQAKKLNVIQSFWLSISFLIEYITQKPDLYFFTRYIIGAFNYVGLIFNWPDNHKIIEDGNPKGFYAMSSIQAILGISQLRRIKENQKHRKEIFNVLETSIGWYNSDRSLPLLRYAFLVKNRDYFLSDKKNGVLSSIWFDSPISGGSELYDDVDYYEGLCPIAEIVSKHIVNVSITSKMNISSLSELSNFNRSSLLRPNMFNKKDFLNKN